VNRSIGTPQNARSRRTRAAILDATWRLIEEEGAEALAIAEVARRAGITRRAIYLHFASRGELLLALFDHVNETLDLAASNRPVFEAPDALSALDAAVVHVAHFHAEILPLARAIDRARRSDPDAEAFWQNAMRYWYGGCQMLVGRLVAEGRLAEPWTERTAADLLWAFMSVELIEDLVHDRGWTREEYAERLALLLRRALTR
jgi:AcrR family transcriptional regulator